MRKCSLENLQALFAEIAKEAKLYLPVDNQDGTASFKEWSEGTALSEALNTTKSPKDFFFPQTEDLMAFKTEGKSIEVIDVREESKVPDTIMQCDRASLVFTVTAVDDWIVDNVSPNTSRFAVLLMLVNVLLMVSIDVLADWSMHSYADSVLPLTILSTAISVVLLI